MPPEQDPVEELADHVEDELDEPEKELFSALADMLAMPGFLLPLIAAQRQYREHYYGLSAAALLEDVFYDAFTNYLSQFRPEVTFERPPRGHKEWDYRFQGLEVSHKVGEGPSDLAALWDATFVLPDPPVWTFDSPIVYLSSSYVDQVGELRWRGATRGIKALKGTPEETLGASHRLLLVHWPVQDPPRVAWISPPAPAGITVTEFLPFEEVWREIAGEIRDGSRANHLEVFRTTAAMATEPDGVEEETALVFKHRAGISLFPVAELTNVTVTKNNRAVLLPRATVAEKMTQAATDGLFVPLPLWFRIYTSARPPDLYLAQRSEYDALFSPAAKAPKASENIVDEAAAG